MFLMSCYEQTMLRMTILTLTEEEEGLQAFNPLQFRVPCMCLGFLKEVYHLRNFTEPRRGQYTAHDENDTKGDLPGLQKFSYYMLL